MVHIRALVDHPDLGLTLVTRGAIQRDIGWVAEGPIADVLEHANAEAVVILRDSGEREQHRAWLEVVADIAKRRVAALGFRVRNDIENIPGDLVRAAASLQVALVRVPPHTTHTKLARAIADLARSDTVRGAREALLTQRTLLELVHDGTGDAGMVAAIASLTGRSAAIIDETASTVAATGGFSHENPAQTLEIGSGRQLVVQGEALGPEASAAFTAAAIVLSIEDRTRTHNTVLERERWGRVTRALVTGDPHGAGFAKILDPDQRLPESVHVVVVQGPAETIAQWRSRPRIGAERFVTRYPLEDHRGTEIAPGVALAWQMVSPDDLDSALASITTFGLDALVGLHTDVADATLSRRSAEALLPHLSVAEQLYQVPRTPRIIYAERSTPLIARLTGTRDADALARERLGPLHAMHRDHAEFHELRRTLETFLAHHGQRAGTAEALGIHRNTLRTRLTRIEHVLDCSLDSADDRAELWIALRLDSASGA